MIFLIERMYLNRDSIIHTTVILCSQTLNLLKMASNGSFGGCRLRDRDLGPRFFVFYPLGGSLGHPCDQSKHRWSPTCGCTVYNDLCIQCLQLFTMLKWRHLCNADCLGNRAAGSQGQLMARITVKNVVLIAPHPALA